MLELHHPYPTPDEFFDVAPEGEFKWGRPELHDPCADETPSYCDDCDDWHHGYQYTMEMGRRADGTRWLDVISIDEEGDSDCLSSWDEREGDDEDAWLECMNDLDTKYYFRQCAKYWLWAAEHGKDPRNYCLREIKTKNEWFRFCIQGAQDDIRYLLMGFVDQVVAEYKGCEITIYREDNEKDEYPHWNYSFSWTKTKEGEELSPFVSDDYSAKDEYDALHAATVLINKYCR